MDEQTQQAKTTGVFVKFKRMYIVMYMLIRTRYMDIERAGESSRPRPRPPNKVLQFRGVG